MAAKSR